MKAMLHNDFYYVVNKQKEKLETQLATLLRNPFNQAELEELLKDISINYEVHVYCSNSEDEDELEEQSSALKIKVEGAYEWKEKTWQGPLLDYDDVLTNIFAINENIKNEIMAIELALFKLLPEETRKQTKLNNKKNVLEENLKSLYDYLQYCTNQVLLPDVPIANISRQNIQKSIALAIERNDFNFAKKMLIHPKLKTFSLLRVVSLDGKQDNLLHYFLIHQSQSNPIIRRAYAISMKDVYDFNEVFNFPQEMLSLIYSTNKVSGELGILLLFEYTQEKFRELKVAFNLFEHDREHLIKDELKNKFLEAMKTLSKWQKIMETDEFSANSQEMHAKILSNFNHCFIFNKKTPTKALECYIRSQLGNGSEVISDAFVQLLLSEKCKELNAGRKHFQQDLLKIEEERMKQQSNYDNETVALYNKVTQLLDQLCESAALRDSKEQNALVGIQRALIKDYDGKTRKFSNSEEFSLYLKEDIMAKDLALSEKLERIIRTVEEVHNSMNRKRHKFFGTSNQMVTGLRNLLENFAEHFNDISLCKKANACEMVGLSSMIKRLDQREKLPDFLDKQPARVIKKKF
ncbi:MAG: hypothetical protein JO149_00010 [Gammaproteobacteria bacterium]|nr:hypothetical protein [Gammaproteobacteria bacterium]